MRASGEHSEQLALSPFAPGDMVRFYGEHGWRAGRFLRLVTHGRRRGLAEVALGGRLVPEQRVWVEPGRLSALATRGATALARSQTRQHTGDDAA